MPPTRAELVQQLELFAVGDERRAAVQAQLDALPEVYEFDVVGDPRPQPRAKAWFNKKTERMHHRDPGTANSWKGLVALAWAAVRPSHSFDDAVSLRIACRFARPAGHFGTGKNAAVLKPSAPRYPCGRPDLDNCAKAVMDCLTDQAAWTDDDRVCDLIVSKRYVAAGELPGAHVTIRVLR